VRLLAEIVGSVIGIVVMMYKSICSTSIQDLVDSGKGSYENSREEWNESFQKRVKDPGISPVEPYKKKTPQ